MRNLICCLFVLILISTLSAAPLHVKVAILDNFHSEELPSDQYQTFYMNGIALAAQNALKQGIQFDYKVFVYGTGPLDVITAAEEAEKWQPDLIIGPRASNQFLLLPNFIQNILVLSPYATADAVNDMPDNFYSLTFPNTDSATAISYFLMKNFQKKNLVILTQVDCKSCAGLATQVIKNYSAINKGVEIHQSFFLQSQASSLDLAQALQNVNLQNSIVFLPDMSYPAGILMVRVTNYAKMPMTFVGADDWGDWRDGIVGKQGANYYYQGFRVVPWAQENDTPFAKDFMVSYKQAFKGTPDGASFIPYTTLSSVTAALLKYPEICNGHSSSSCILATYQKALQEDPVWFRSASYYVYHIDTTGEKYIGPVYQNEVQHVN